MPKYLWEAAYTAEGSKGLLKEGGTKRRAAVAKAVESAGGTIESFYFAFGANDVYVIADYPDHASAAAASLTVAASGRARVKTTVLLSLEEIDAATKKRLTYRPLGR